MIGATARELLTRPGFVGRVLAVVTGAVYLAGVIARSAFEQSEAESRDCDEAIPTSRSGDCFAPARLAMTQDEILWLAQNDLPMHPRALRGDFDFRTLRVGMTVQSDGARLEFVGAHLIAPLQNARVWQPPTIEASHVVPRGTLIARSKDLTGFSKPVRSPADARTLIGLGEGLTPAGDDFVGGWLFAAYHLHAAYPQAARWDQRAVDDLLTYARARTNVISCALLGDHARGQSIEPLHAWLVAWLHGAAAREIRTRAQRVRALGSSTGKNLLAGALAALQSFAGD